MKRGQVSVFLIVAIILIIVIALLIYVQYSFTKKTKEINLQQTATFSEKVKQVSTLVESCIEQETKKAIEIYGIDEKNINQDILNKLKDCAKFSIFSNLDIKAKDFEVSTIITTYAIEIKVNWPITIKKGSEISNLNEFIYRLDLYKEVELKLDSNNEVLEDTYLVSDDEKASLLIKKGTIIFVSDNIINKITMQLVNCETQACFGPLSYILGPSNAVLYTAAIYTIKYDENFLGDISEEDLRISWYDENRDLWFTYDTQRVDTDKNEIIAEVDHL